MRNLILRILEEAFPFLFFIKNKTGIFKKLNDTNNVTLKAKEYSSLSVDNLVERIQEEHERAVKIDDKTSKFTLGLSVSLTVLAAASGSFVKFIPKNDYASIVSITCGIASIYMLLAGITALGALKTLPTYGYGTHHLINTNKDGVSYLSEALYAQERMNIIRQLRNESAYQSLRNGFFMLLFALSISVALLSDAKGKPKVNNVVPTSPVVALDGNSSKIKSKDINNLTAKPSAD